MEHYFPNEKNSHLWRKNRKDDLLERSDVFRTNFIGQISFTCMGFLSNGKSLCLSLLDIQSLRMSRLWGLYRVCVGLFGASAKAIICNNGLFATLKAFSFIAQKIGICVYYFHK